MIIKTPQPDLEERLVVVPVRRIVPESRDATPDDLARAGYVAKDRYDNASERVDEFAAEIGQLRGRAEKAERELAEVREAAFDADSGPGEAPTAFEAVTGLRLRVERAERERNDVLRDPCARGRSWEAMRSDRDRLLTVALDAERELVEARAELARLTAPVEEPRIVPGSADHLEAWSAIAAFVESGGGTSSSVATQKAVVRIEGAFRSFVALGVAHERARLAAAGVTVATAEDAARFEVQPAQDRATDEELCALFRGVRSDPGEPDASRSVNNAVIAVAARVRKERCLVAQAVAANVDIRVCEDDGGGFMVGVHESGCDEELARCVPAAEVPATLASLLGGGAL